MTRHVWTHTVTGGPWPERHGHRCRIVPPPRDEYPWDRPNDSRYVVVLIENDPFAVDGLRDRSWSCVLHGDDITEGTSTPDNEEGP